MEALVGADVVDVENVGVIEGRNRARLFLEPVEAILVAGDFRRQDLYGDVASQPRIPGLVDDAHASAAESAENLVRAEQAASGDHGVRDCAGC
jgi:hypothetical protein